VRLRRSAVIAVAGVAFVAGCGSGSTGKTVSTSTVRRTTPSTTPGSTKPKKTATGSGAPAGSGKHQPALAWIRNLQRDLTRLHFYSGPVTGIETPETRNAVIRFQRAAHLKPDGLWGPKSQAALDKMLHRNP
jgi:peptidoglycan hydrolase-like protein with peptidoglycan-binding domain